MCYFYAAKLSIICHTAMTFTIPFLSLRIEEGAYRYKQQKFLKTLRL
jgi:hypothetical protein